MKRWQFIAALFGFAAAARAQQWKACGSIDSPAVLCFDGQQRHFGGHVNVGPITIYGWNAMHLAVNIKFRGTYICFHPTWRMSGKWWRWYFYISPDATPQGATFRMGPGVFD